MIDFHTHILPNLDDGARSIEEAQQLIKEAKNAGFDKVILTTHYMEGHYEKNINEREKVQEELARNIKDVETYLGNEIYLSSNIIKLLEDEKASTINNTSYVLFEMSMEEEPLDLYDNIYNMIRNKVVPILAHPERYPYIQKEPDIIYELIEKGVYMQVDYGSFIGESGTKAKMIAMKMLENNSVHFLGTNAHKANTIYKYIPGIVEILKNKIGKEKVYEITTKNPDLALHNKRIDMPEPNEIRLSIQDKLKMFFLK